MDKLTQPAFIMGIIGSAKLMLEAFGLHIPDATVNDIINGAAAVVTVIGIIKDHGKPLTKPPEHPIVAQQTTTQPPAQP